MKDVFLAIGSNLGDRKDHLDFALQTISEMDGVELIAKSDVYETEPLSGPNIPADQQTFLNGALHIRTDMDPLSLLHALQKIEIEAGRAAKTDRVHWGPRELDIDILLFGNDVIELGEELQVPHPRMCERWFVLKPLSDLAAEFEHPINGRTISQMLKNLERMAAATGIEGFLKE